MIAVGAGVQNCVDYVLYDQIVNLRSDNKPSQVDADVINSFIYDGRVEERAIPQWDDLVGTLQDEIRNKCQRLICDTVL